MQPCSYLHELEVALRLLLGVHVKARDLGVLVVHAGEIDGVVGGEDHPPAVSLDVHVRDLGVGLDAVR